jgi:hypothetical protein
MSATDVKVGTKPLLHKQVLISRLIGELTKSLEATGRTRNAVELKLANIDSVVGHLQPYIQTHLTRLIEKRDGSHYQWSLSVAVRSALHDRDLLSEAVIEPEPAPSRKSRTSDWSEDENRLIVARYLDAQDQLREFSHPPSRTP